MRVRGAIRAIVQSVPGGDILVRKVRLQRIRRDWTVVHRARSRKSTLSFFTTVGIGDVMIAKQVCEAFIRYCEQYGDPGLGHVVITAGAWPPNFRPERGDHNVYWWWSMNGREDWLDFYIGNIATKPDTIACLSTWCSSYAQSRAYKTVSLPLGVGEHFLPLHNPRAGVGYGGSRNHKDSSQIDSIVAPFCEQADFEWVDSLTTPQELNCFYNRKQIVLGMTEVFQERAGMVNNRVFEVLASGTPFIIHRHRALQETLGFDYPYQSSCADETLRLAGEILMNFPKHRDVFREYSRIVLARHTYDHRVGTLVNHLISGGRDPR